MSRIKWLVEDDAFPEDVTPLFEALSRQDIDFAHVQYPMSKWGDPNYLCEITELFHVNECVVFYGSLQLGKALRRASLWIPGVYYNPDMYDCISYYPYLGNMLLNREYIILPYGELIRRKMDLFRYIGQDRAVFIRPDRGDKLFTGKVVYQEHFEEEVGSFNHGQMRPHELVVVARPYAISGEWRFVIVNNRAIAGSRYKGNDKYDPAPEYPIDALLCAEKAATKYSPEHVFVVDVCLTGDDYAVMEVGCFSCAGLYSCNRDAVVNEVSAAALLEWAEYNDG